MGRKDREDGALPSCDWEFCSLPANWDYWKHYKTGNKPDAKPVIKVYDGIKPEELRKNH